MIAMNDTIVKPGDRIELISMANDPDPIPPGTQGTVKFIHKLTDWAQIDVDWDNGRSLMLVTPEDQFRVIGRQKDID